MSEAISQLDQKETDPLKSVATALATAAEGVRSGAIDALAKAKQTIPVAGKYVSRFVYSGFYYFSYGVVFPTLLGTNFIPGCGSIASGLVDGATAAKDAIVEMKEKSAARRAAKTEAQVAQLADSAARNVLNAT